MNRRVIPEKRTSLADRFSKNASRHLPTSITLSPSFLYTFLLAKICAYMLPAEALRLIFIPVIAATAAETVLHGMDIDPF